MKALATGVWSGIKKRSRFRRPLAVGSVALGLWMGQVPVLFAQSAPVALSPQLQEIVRLNRAHLGDDVIRAYIKNSGAPYRLTADDILYLNAQGVSQSVLGALLESSHQAVRPNPPVVVAPPPLVSQPRPVTVAPQTAGPGSPGVVTPPPYVQPTAPPPAANEVNFAYFQNQLSPYGAWIQVAPYGWCWRPTEAQRVPDWRPYLNAGHWAYTDAGWCWQSDYPWGEIAFHYGRWTQDPSLGWIWAPGYNWGPAWVCWRHTGDYFGWAPLPPAARFEAGAGLTFGGRVVADFDFGLGPGAFCFVGADHFWARDLRAFAVPRWRAPGLFRASVVVNGYHFAGGRFIVEGPGRDRVAALTHHEIREERVEFRDRRIAHEVEAQRARAAQFQRGPGERPGSERGGEGRMDERRPNAR